MLLSTSHAIECNAKLDPFHDPVQPNAQLPTYRPRSSDDEHHIEQAGLAVVVDSHLLGGRILVEGSTFGRAVGIGQDQADQEVVVVVDKIPDPESAKETSCPEDDIVVVADAERGEVIGIAYLVNDRVAVDP